MRSFIVILSLVASLTPVDVRADTTSALANTLALSQALDIASTESIIQKHGFERDPFVKPVVHSLPEYVVTEGLLNIFLRRVHNPTILRLAIGVEVITLANNYRILVRLSR